MKASIPGVYTTSYRLNNIRNFVAFTAASVQLKKPSGGPKGLIGPTYHVAIRTSMRVRGRFWRL